MREALFGALTTLATRHLSVQAAQKRNTPQWERTNYRNRSVSLSGGVAQAFTLIGTGLPIGLAWPQPGVAHAIACATSAAAGYLDDMKATRDRRHGKEPKGLKGHLGELSRGHVTTGALKIAGIGTGAAVSAAITTRYRDGSPLDWAVNTVLIAGSANLANLFDLRPGRALKVTMMAVAPLLAKKGPTQALAASILTAAATQLPQDMAETHMLGDTGANPLGAACGLAWATGGTRRQRLIVALIIIAATLASEKISFSRIIDHVPALSMIDRLGRRD